MRAIFMGLLLVSRSAQSVAEIPSDPADRTNVAAVATLAALTPPQPTPPGPPDAPRFLSGPDPVLTSTGDPRVDAFRERVLTEAGSRWTPYLLRLFRNVR